MVENSTEISLEIIWDSCAVREWQGFFDSVPKSNIIQTDSYAYALRDIRHQVTRFGLIEVNRTPVGIVQIQEIKLFGIIHFIFLDRGPVWFKKPDDNIIEAFFNKFNSMFPKRIGRKRRVMPELPDSLFYLEMMKRCGFKKKAQGYRSIWLDLSLSMDNLRGNLHSKWRNTLNKAEKNGLNIIDSPVSVSLPWLLNVYIRDRLKKKYNGASAKLIDKLVSYAKGKSLSPLLLRAEYSGGDAAAILIFMHGSTATYQIGWTNDIGRDKSANNLLLWEAIKILKKRGIKWLDLGGVNHDTAQGVTKFKQRMGGEPYTLLGVFS